VPPLLLHYYYYYSSSSSYYSYTNQLTSPLSRYLNNP